jgi:Pentapeptide repeats (8 copies)
LLKRLGDQHSDWQIAEQIVRSPIRKTLFASHCQLIKVEKSVWEPLLAWANNQALFGLIGVVGNIGLIIGVIVYVVSEKQRRDAEVLNAWQTITSAHGQAGSGGRIEALEFLNASPGANWRRKFPWLCPAPHPLCTWPQESLAGINLGVEIVENHWSIDQSSASDGLLDWLLSYRNLGVYLMRIQLPGADLTEANLQGAFLAEANLRGAVLMGANLQRANLVGVDLRGAVSEGADLQGAIYSHQQTPQKECESLLLRHPCPTLFPKGFDPKAAGMKLVK